MTNEQQAALTATEGEVETAAQSATEPFATGSLTPVVAAVLVSVALGGVAALMFGFLPSLLLVSPAVGIAAALACDSRMASAVSAGLGMAAGAAMGTWLLAVTPKIGLSPAVDIAAASIAAAAVAVGAHAFVSAGNRRSLAGLAVVLLIGCAWYSGITAANLPNERGISFADNLAHTPKVYEGTSDAVFYYLYTVELANGQNYYRSAVALLQMANATRSGQLNAASPLSYREPTMYWILSRLPRTGMSYVLATLVVGAIAAFSAYVLARQFAREPAALVSTALVAGYYAGHSYQSQLFNTELWAGALALLSMTLLVKALSREVVSWKLMAGAAAAACAATLVRELAAAFIVVGVASVLADPRLRRPRYVLPWAVSFIVAALGFTAHIVAVRSALAGVVFSDGAYGSLVWFHPDGLGLLAAIDRLGIFGGMLAVGGWVLLGLAAAGSLGAPDRTSQRVALGTVVLGGIAVLLVLYPPGVTPSGLPPSYWADLVLPTMLACAPLGVVAAGRWATGRASRQEAVA